MYVVLDTNILHQEGLTSRNMKRLERVCQTGRLAVCVPDMVLREFVTHKVADARETLAKFKMVFPETKKRLPGSKLADKAESIERIVQEFENELESGYKEYVEEWKQQLKVEVLGFNPDAIKDVFDDYFSGSGAFKLPKRREDIPDSLIGYSILPLSERGRCERNRERRCVKKIPRDQRVLDI